MHGHLAQIFTSKSKTLGNTSKDAFLYLKYMVHILKSENIQNGVPVVSMSICLTANWSQGHYQVGKYPHN